MRRFRGSGEALAVKCDEHCMRIWSNLKVQTNTNYIKLSLYTSLMSQFCSGIWNLGWLRIPANSSWIFLVVPKCSKVYLQCSHVLSTIGIQSVYNQSFNFCKMGPLSQLEKSSPSCGGEPVEMSTEEVLHLDVQRKGQIAADVHRDFFCDNDLQWLCYILLHFVTTFPYISHNFSINIINPAQVVPWWQIQIRNEHRTH